jgi:hypothetical protein
LQLYTGMRTKQCRLICRLPCRAVEPIRLEFRPSGFSSAVIVGKSGLHEPRDLDRFARFDGFADFDAMRVFWYEEHGAVPFFEGFHIRWLDLPAELQVAA